MRKRWIWLVAVMVAIVGLYVGHALARPLSVSEPNIKLPNQQTAESTLAWPDQGRAAVGFIDPASGEISCRTNGIEGEFPTASLAKVITALVVLQKHPIATGTDGATLTMTGDDVARWQTVVNSGGSNVQIVAGEVLTERQMLQAIMLASANNFADSLAIWAFGSLDNYRAAAETWLTDHHLYSTTIGPDASGFNPGTKSSSADLCQLILTASENPTLAAVMSTATINNFPVVGTLVNTNRLLNQDNIIGGKTGFTDEAGHGVLLLAHVQVGGTQHVVAVAMLGQDSYDAVFANGQKLLDSVAKNLTVREIAVKNQIIGKVDSAWNASANLVAKNGLAVTTWTDEKTNVEITLPKIAQISLTTGETVGTIVVADRSVDIAAAKTLPPAGWWWRIWHGF